MHIGDAVSDYSDMKVKRKIIELQNAARRLGILGLDTAELAILIPALLTEKAIQEIDQAAIIQ